jgi:RNA polymerase sigma-70 factor (ECF subfamily)
VATPADETAWVTAARDGDTDAFAQLVRAHQEAAFRAAYLIVRDAAAAEDVAQEAFVRAYRALGSFNAGDPFRPWLLRIATNLALNEVRGRRRREGWLGRLRMVRPAEPRTPEALAVASDELRELDLALQQLPERDRAVLYLRHFFELSEKEMAVALNCAPGTVKSRLNRASARLRDVIEREHPSLVPPGAAGKGEPRATR